MDSTKDLSGQTDTGKVKRIHKPCQSAAGNQDDEAHSSAKRQSVRRCDVHEDTVGEPKVLRRKVLQLARAYQRQCVIHEESPESICVSMKSDRSMDHPHKFSSGAPCADVSVIHGESPEPSCVSMKSDESMRQPLTFSSGESLINYRNKQDQSESTAGKVPLDSIFEELEHKIISLMKKELKSIKRLLISDSPACSERGGGMMKVRSESERGF
ncbi:uncharacterized protein LOC127642487 [Xyrauchen texanus]|uniref:uncharacterized protein LOC127642487 n=1 Tax=Xyrauchen texanus TaxID=154827 RepID=UPI002242BE97|nr:uncharacterized protein LOC127642487 [Xyrauchen texanus]